MVAEATTQPITQQNVLTIKELLQKLTYAMSKRMVPQFDRNISLRTRSFKMGKNIEVPIFGEQANSFAGNKGICILITDGIKRNNFVGIKDIVRAKKQRPGIRAYVPLEPGTYIVILYREGNDYTYVILKNYFNSKMNSRYYLSKFEIIDTGFSTINEKYKPMIELAVKLSTSPLEKLPAYSNPFITVKQPIKDNKITLKVVDVYVDFDMDLITNSILESINDDPKSIIDVTYEKLLNECINRCENKPMLLYFMYKDDAIYIVPIGNTIDLQNNEEIVYDEILKLSYDEIKYNPSFTFYYTNFKDMFDNIGFRYVYKDDKNYVMSLLRWFIYQP